MKQEYDFTKAEQGKFYRPIEELDIPIYLERDVEIFFYQMAMRKKSGLRNIVGAILRKEMDLLKEIG